MYWGFLFDTQEQILCFINTTTSIFTILKSLLPDSGEHEFHNLHFSYTTDVTLKIDPFLSKKLKKLNVNKRITHD